MRAPSRASQRFSRVLVLDKAVDALRELHEEDFDDGITIVESHDDHEAAKRSNLPPTDRGLRAYLFMLSAFTIEAIMWGKFMQSFFSLFFFIISFFYSHFILIIIEMFGSIIFVGCKEGMRVPAP
jgi:hypothetical protein